MHIGFQIPAGHGQSPWSNRENTMATKKTAPARKTEKVPVPTKKEVGDAARLLRGGHSAGGRVMNEQKVAKKK